LKHPVTVHRQLTFVACRPHAREHEVLSHRRVAERLATFLDCPFVALQRSEVDPSRSLGYVVPNDTLESIELAAAWGIRGEQDLYGGVVPLPFIATKTISHPLVAPGAAAPAGWQAAFGERVREVVLPGLAAYSPQDARMAGLKLLQGGEVRVKMAGGRGGAGQSVARNEAELDAVLAAIDLAELSRTGVVVERNLARIRTYSVGMLRVGSVRTCYFGTQRNTINRHGKEVYGGSSLIVARGEIDALTRLAPDAGVQRAIAQATAYHAAALACFPGLLVSRCNYDVAAGEDAAGAAFSGVLEQSWRLGGASPAEVEALIALKDDPQRPFAHASCVEIHGAVDAAPDGASLYYSGVDEHLGPITKYAWLHDS
jgi:hypothetical protein